MVVPKIVISLVALRGMLSWGSVVRMNSESASVSVRSSFNP